MSGKLVLVGTPIGNLSDFSPRGVEALKSADLILCEDTRHTRKLLTHFGIERPLQSFHDHNEDEKAAAMGDRIAAGETIALVSDAGTPVISDPGFRLVRLARERGLPTEAIPGPFAAIVALVASGIAPLPFTFHGFTPHRHGERTEFYRRVAAQRQTAIIYESPERVVESLQDARTALGEVEVTVAREMTKIHEEFVSGTLSEVIEKLRQRPSIRGEITVVFGASRGDVASTSPAEVAAEFERLRASGMRRNDAVKAVAEKFGLRKNDVYRMLL
jgi:16S rRNA (cytidine1402-2'-O)-methyltransferase